MRVRISDQLVDFVRHLAPEPHRQVRQALRDLAAGKGDIKPPEAPLDAFTGKNRPLSGALPVRNTSMNRLHFH
ncbi:MAG TPA: hypothetical protein VEB21_16330 [Terriglobales bacterium]|nr:hypothetical protein [Terriglobales bacterium]